MQAKSLSSLPIIKYTDSLRITAGSVVGSFLYPHPKKPQEAPHSPLRESGAPRGASNR